MEVVPSKEEMRIPILKCLSDGNICTVDELVDGVVKIMGLPQSVLEVKATGKEKSEFKNRLEWACTGLKKEDLISYPQTAKRKTANRQITPIGREYLENH